MSPSPVYDQIEAVRTHLHQSIDNGLLNVRMAVECGTQVREIDGIIEIELPLSNWNLKALSFAGGELAIAIDALGENFDAEINVQGESLVVHFDRKHSRGSPEELFAMRLASLKAVSDLLCSVAQIED